ncbi:hypothetical protein FCV12_11935 [Clostridium botulinum]|nr:hypothetical protein [Clostridium botulinum]NFQ89863.1 hypothetical protein [Clostridium botulinum]NFR05005.1 hypothetical protein [Clostridium botulinum]NFU74523.1 hypothetical protein [Clostridium botulinum]
MFSILIFLFTIIIDGDIPPNISFEDVIFCLVINTIYLLFQLVYILKSSNIQTLIVFNVFFTTWIMSFWVMATINDLTHRHSIYSIIIWIMGFSSNLVVFGLYLYKKIYGINKEV